MTSTDRGDGAATALAAHGLDGTAFGPPLSPLSEPLWDALQHRVLPDRLWFLLADALATDWPATDAQRDQAVAAEERAATQVLALDRGLLALAEVLDAASAPFRVLKGPAHAHGLWRRPELRVYSDLDVVVPGAAFDRAAVAVGAALGGRRHRPEPRAGFTARVGKSATFTLPDGIEVDLHRTLADGPFGASVVTPDLFAGGDEVQIGRRRLPTLSRPAMFVHACLHAHASGGRPLVPLRDVAEGLQRLDGGDQPAVVECSTRWGCRAVVAWAIRTARATFRLDAVGTTPDHGSDLDLVRWAEALVPTASERARLLVVTGSFPGRAVAETAAMVPALPSWSDRATFVRGVVAGDHRSRWRHRLARVGRR